jgi:predicted lipoprotein with Yx(FWY)xxD motif
VRKLILIPAVLGLIAFTGCGGTDKQASSQETRKAGAPTAAKRTAAKPTTVEVMKTRYGRILVDGRGRALYLFTRESGPTARCYGACANAWPVFGAGGSVRAGTGANRHLIGTTHRRDGTRQVTYAGHPLYYYVTDRRPGEVTCQNVDEYGGTWLVVAPGGTAIRRS